MGALFWLYVTLKIFVLDVDRVAVTTFAPAVLPLLDYRLIGYLVLVAFVVYRRWWLYLAYVALFPLAVVFGWTPWFLFRHRSWPLFLGLLHVACSLLKDVRYNIVTKAIAMIAAILILTTDNRPLVFVSASYIACLAVWSLLRRLRRVFSTPSFVSVQQDLIRRIMSSPRMLGILSLKDEYKSGAFGQYDQTQAQQVAMTISYGIAVNKILCLWAYQLDRYRRRYAPSVVFNLISYAWLFLATLAALTLLNVALLNVAPDQFVVDGPRPLVAVVVYSLGTFTLGEAGGMRPTGQWAYGVQLAGGIAGLLILASLAINILLSVVRERDDAATRDLIQDLKDRARQQERRFVDEYAVSVDEAFERLQRLGAGAAWLLAYLVQSIPPEIADKDIAV